MDNQLSFFIKPVDDVKKIKVMFLQDDKLHKDFKKDAIFEVYKEQKDNYIIFYDNVYYGPFKNACIKL